MANLFLSIAVPATDGVGASVAVGSMGRIKNIALSGTLGTPTPTATVTVEMSVDGANWFPVHTFSTTGTKALSVAGAFARCRVANAIGAVTAACTISANDDGISTAVPVAPAGNGAGALLPSPDLGEFKSIYVTGSFTGSVTVEASQDGVSWTALASFNSRGLTSLLAVSGNLRVVRADVDPQQPGLPNVQVAAVNDLGAGSSAGVDIMGLNNIRDFGASGNGVTDDRQAVQDAIDDAVALGVAGIWAPPGTYAMTRNNGAGIFASIDMNGISDFMILGRGGKSVFKMIGSGSNGDWYMFRLRNSCTNILFQNLKLDGNYANITDLDEQTHLVNMTGNSGPTSRIRFQNVEFRDSHGDGVRMIGEVANKILQVEIASCDFIDCQRSGIGVQRATQGVWVHDNYLTGGTDQLIDHEPTGTGTTEDHCYERNILDNTRGTSKGVQWTLGGNGEAQRNERCRVYGNTALDCNVRGLNIRFFEFQNNTILGNSFHVGTEATVEHFRGVDNSVWSQNYVERPNTTNGNVIALSSNAGFAPRRCQIIGNHFIQRASAATIYTDAMTNLVVAKNVVEYLNSDTNLRVGITFRSINNVIDNIVCNDNVVRGDVGGGSLLACIRFSASPNDVGAVQASFNQCEGASIGVRFEEDGLGAVYTEAPIVQGNFFASSVTSDIDGLSNALASLGCVIGGGVGATAVRDVMGTGSPENVIAARVGSTFRRRDGGAGTSLYVKESGTGNTGWVAK